MKRTELTQVEAKEAILNAQAVFCLILKNHIADDLTRFVKSAVVRLELAKDFIGKCPMP